jgi:hypothetical protein
VAQYALYLLNRLYDPESVIWNLRYLAAYLITETASQDGKVGGSVQMATLRATGGQILGTTVVEGLLLKNRERSRALKESFLKNEYGMGSAYHRHVGPVMGLEAPSETAYSAAPVVVPIEESAAAPDPMSSVAEKTTGDFALGIIW